MRAEFTLAETGNGGQFGSNQLEAKAAEDDRGQAWSASPPTVSQAEPVRPAPRTVLTVTEVAEHLRCSKAHVYKVIEGKIPSVSPLPAIFMGRRKLVRLDTLEVWKRTNEQSHGNGNIVSSPKVDAALRT